MSIYVEILIGGPLETLWQRTQIPELHQRWDLRFSSISYLPRPDPAQPQRFHYATRIGFGLAINGEGETRVAQSGARGSRTSALTFWSVDPKSLIRVGSGYWKYVPGQHGVRFITRYDYQTRFGWLGRGIDRAVFRPLMGWATAWSFDRLRLWIEQGVDPQAALRRSLALAAGRLAVAVACLSSVLGGPFSGAAALRLLAGALLAWPDRRGWAAAGALLLLGLVGAGGSAGTAVLAPTVGALAACALGFHANRNIPSARRCRRTYREEL